MTSTVPPLLADICTAAANAVDAQASIDEHPDRYVVTFGRAGSDTTANLTVQKQLFADAIDWGERRIRAELEHEAAKVCETLRVAHRCPTHGTENFCALAAKPAT